jgi:SAM-dependent methyltransferase
MKLRARFRQIDEFIHERWLGISTAEWHQVHDPEKPDFRGYGPTSYRDWRIIRRHITPKGSFIDYGAGLGRVTALAARFPFNRVIGIDLDPDLVKRGNQNLEGARGLKCDARIVCQDATTFQVPHDASMLYFCNPFSGKVLEAVLQKVRGRYLSLVCNLPPVSGFEHEIRQIPWLALQTEFALSDHRKCLIFRPAM